MTTRAASAARRGGPDCDRPKVEVNAADGVALSAYFLTEMAGLIGVTGGPPLGNGVGLDAEPPVEMTPPDVVITVPPELVRITDAPDGDTGYTPILNDGE